MRERVTDEGGHAVTQQVGQHRPRAILALSRVRTALNWVAGMAIARDAVALGIATRASVARTIATTQPSSRERNCSMIESLESRQFMSASSFTPSVPIPPPRTRTTKVEAGLTHESLHAKEPPAPKYDYRDWCVKY